METPQRYHPMHVTLHWLIAIGVFLNLYLGIITFHQRPSGPAAFRAHNTFVVIHMATGIIVLLLLLIRFFMRTRVPIPEAATSDNSFFDLIARLVHYGLYLAVLAVTVIGLIFSLQTGRFQSAFLGAESRFGPPPGGFPQGEGAPGVQPPNQNGNPPQGAFEGQEGGGFNLLEIHEWAAYALLGLVAVHILASLYHQFLRRDHLLARMWYGTR